MKLVTLLFLRQEGEILLAMKKRGFGAGKWNGAGGKVGPDETVRQAAIRECQEEIGVTPENPQLVGRFYFFDLPNIEHDCHVYTATEWEGEPQETEEMRPQWFATTNIPYEQMWADDKFWVPLMLEGRFFKGTVEVDNGQLVQCNIRAVKKLEEHP